MIDMHESIRREQTDNGVIYDRSLFTIRFFEPLLLIAEACYMHGYSIKVYEHRQPIVYPLIHI